MTATAPPPLSDLFRTFGRIGLLSFGGPAAQIALMHRTLVDEQRWLSEPEYLRALSFCMLLPGPEAMQLATYAGWKFRGVPGGLVAGGLFVLPGAIVILALAALYAAWGGVPLVSALFFGVKACVTVIVLEALLRVANRALKTGQHRAFALLAFLGLFAFSLPFPAIIAVAALAGAILHRGTPGPAVPAPPISGSVPALGLGLALWAAPLAALAFLGQAFLLQVGLFFSKLAVVTFGGAYAVLAYMTQTVVQEHGWLTTPQMMDALGLAETTPGPLILVTEFVGFLAGFGEGGMGTAMAAALLTLWVTFVPCFLWIFAFAPFVEWTASRRRLGAALAGVTAAVVGVIGNLALWFALHVLFTEVETLRAGPVAIPFPDASSFDARAGLVALLAGVLLLRFRWSLLSVLGLSSTLGAALVLFGPN
ncbi:chromate efflux transporter [Ostreiculturibacter nitratireducens]|uniref:chromate efflux transporter n=1 Tax=Ostreiculturibacter nitratireducens TaxID=3075226 RepID=UPI0031B5DF4E